MKEATQIVRSFVRREHRMTAGQARALTAHWATYGLKVELGYLELPGECILEIGFGMGRSLLAMAMQYPDKNFIGVEVHRPGIGALLLAAAKQQVTNIRVYNDDAINVIKQCIKNNTLTKIQIFFPDPWPKNRHRKRRLIQPDFIALLQQKLKPGGCLHLATDCRDYAEQMLRIIENNPNFSNCAGSGKYLSHSSGRVVTKFEQRGIEAGRGVWDLLFEKIELFVGA
jgi:tRNA (guanine-N7-)-methyltransferase